VVGARPEHVSGELPEPAAPRGLRLAGLSAPTAVRVGTPLVVAAMLVAHLIGAGVAFVLLTSALPVPDEVDDGRLAARSAAVLLVYLVLVLPPAVAWGIKRARPMRAWALQDRVPTETEREETLRFPQRLATVYTVPWLGAALVFAVVSGGESSAFAFEVGATVALTGLTTGAVAYLIVERLLRPVVATALAGAPLRRYRSPGVGSRALLTWVLASAIPVAGIVAIAIASFGEPISLAELRLTALALGGVALAVGLLATFLLARSITVPLRALRGALQRVEEGDLDAEVRVIDATEIGFAQAGFNRMVVGLRERERVRDLFGRHVGRDVAEQALALGIALGGEELDAAALFVDVIGSTSFAADRSPTEVVDALNRFFAVVVDVAQRHGGSVNKFEGDAALCTFGAPLPLPDVAGAALAAARELVARLPVEAPDLPAAVGVSAGRVVAGNVGAADRYEYTVIGDPVNAAARLTELAKDLPGRAAASAAAVERAGPAESACWVEHQRTVLRGHREATGVWVPADDQAAPAAT
jgi:adenylate cyclase